MFSMSLASMTTAATARKLQLPEIPEAANETAPRPLPLNLGKLDEALPEGGLPRGAVIEISSPYGLARASTLALAACVSAQAEAKLRYGDETAEAWCAWLDPTGSLFAPALARAGVDLERLLVVQPSSDDLGRVAVRVAASGAFGVVVVDLTGVPGCRSAERLERWLNPVRRLCLAVEGSETTVLLLTDAYAQRAMPLPVALRLEVDRAVEDRLMVRVAKDRRGRVSPASSILLAPAAAPLQKSA